MDPVEEVGVSAIICSFDSVEDSLDDLLFLGDRRQETVGVTDDAVELGRSQTALSRLLLSVEALEGDLTGVAEDEGGLNGSKSTNSKKSTSLLELESTLNRFQKTQSSSRWVVSCSTSTTKALSSVSTRNPLAPASYLSKQALSSSQMALTKASSSAGTSLDAFTLKRLLSKSIPFPRYFLMKLRYCWKVMKPSLSVSNSLKI